MDFSTARYTALAQSAKTPLKTNLPYARFNRSLSADVAVFGAKNRSEQQIVNDEVKQFLDIQLQEKLFVKIRNKGLFNIYNQYWGRDNEKGNKFFKSLSDNEQILLPKGTHEKSIEIFNKGKFNDIVDSNVFMVGVNPLIAMAILTEHHDLGSASQNQLDLTEIKKNCPKLYQAIVKKDKKIFSQFIFAFKEQKMKAMAELVKQISERLDQLAITPKADGVKGLHYAELNKVKQKKASQQIKAEVKKLLTAKTRNKHFAVADKELFKRIHHTYFRNVDASSASELKALVDDGNLMLPFEPVDGMTFDALGEHDKIDEVKIHPLLIRLFDFASYPEGEKFPTYISIGNDDEFKNLNELLNEPNSGNLGILKQAIEPKDGSSLNILLSKAIAKAKKLEAANSADDPQPVPKKRNWFQKAGDFLLNFRSGVKKHWLSNVISIGLWVASIFVFPLALAAIAFDAMFLLIDHFKKEKE